MAGRTRRYIPDDELLDATLCALRNRGELKESELYEINGSISRTPKLLERLMSNGLIQARRLTDGRKVLVYSLTEKGRMLCYVDRLRKDMLSVPEISVDSKEVRTVYVSLRTYYDAVDGGQARVCQEDGDDRSWVLSNPDIGKNFVFIFERYRPPINLLRIHNTLTDSVEEFHPIVPGKVSMYVCGVTVYDDIHMGHARSIIVFDAVARYLRYLGYDVTHVTNFTDVDDKIIRRAAEEGVEPLELSARYIRRYFEDVGRLGVVPASIYPKASESIPDIISMIQEIVGNGYGYAAPDGSVYFDVSKVHDYGRLTNQTVDQLQSSGRIADDPNKRGPLDFALWKAAKPGEISWDSPWGRGRPGWHIECSAMIRSCMGEQIDIHGGGNDLIFPHHEDEILQTEAVTGKPLANYWMHNGMLQVKGHGMTKEEKMSKSLGNFFTVRDVLQKFDGRTVRFYFLNTHYMSPLVYGEDMLAEADAARGRLVNNYRELQSYAKRAPTSSADPTDVIAGYRGRFCAAMDEDFNTREAIAVMFEMAKTTNKSMADGTLSREEAEATIALIGEFDGILGIMPDDSSDDGIDDIMSILVDLRKELRARKMYDLSDLIRDRLKDAGYVLEDSAEGAKWKRV